MLYLKFIDCPNLYLKGLSFHKTFVVIMHMLETHSNCNAFLCSLIDESIKAEGNYKYIKELFKIMATLLFTSLK